MPISVGTQLGGSTELNLRRAVLLYSGNREGYASQQTATLAFATVHEYDPATRQLGPGELLTESALHALQATFRPQLALLPPNILATHGDLALWWQPAAAKAMWFTGHPDLSGKVFPQPPLLFLVRGTPPQLQVWALAEDARPDLATPLYQAPYFNIGENAVCQGSMRKPEGPPGATTQAWYDSFFQSEFTAAKRKTHRRGSYADLWQRAAKKGRFDSKQLLPTKHTLGDLIDALRKVPPTNQPD